MTLLQLIRKAVFVWFVMCLFACSSRPVILDDVLSGSSDVVFIGIYQGFENIRITRLAANCKYCDAFDEFYMKVAIFGIEKAEGKAQHIELVIYEENCQLTDDSKYYLVLASRGALGAENVVIWTDSEYGETLFESSLCLPITHDQIKLLKDYGNIE